MLNVLLIFAAAGSPFVGLWIAGLLEKSHPTASRFIIGAMQAAAAVLLVCAMAVKCSGPIDAGHRGPDY